MYTILHEYCSTIQPSSLLPSSFEQTTPLTYLEIPFLVIVVRMSIHTRPWLVTDCPPLAPHPPFPLPTAPLVHVTCFQRRHHNICYSARQISWLTPLNSVITTFIVEAAPWNCYFLCNKSLWWFCRNFSILWQILFVWQVFLGKKNRRCARWLLISVCKQIWKL